LPHLAITGGIRYTHEIKNGSYDVRTFNEQGHSALQ
jgi:hypothetical protein